LAESNGVAIRSFRDAGGTENGDTAAMRRLVLVLAVAIAAVALPLGGAAAASPTFRLTIVHTVSGCHVWGHDAKQLGPSAKIVIARGTRLQIRVNCPMDFDLRQAAGPRLTLGTPRQYAGTSRTLVIRRAGTYKLVGKNVQSSEERNLATLGPDNTLALTIVAR